MDIDSGAAAPAESTATPELPLDTPNPIETSAEGQPEPDAKPEGKPEKTEPKETKPISTREALEKAAAKVEKDSKDAEAKSKPDTRPEVKTAPKAETKEEPKTEVKRDETGKFAPKEEKEKTEVKPSFTASEPPARFSTDAKAKWAETHESVRGETERAIRELTEGLTKYKQSAERDAQLTEFHEMAKQAGKELPAVVREYVNMENYLRKDLVGGLDNICQRMGVSLKDVAAHLMGQTPDQDASAQDATIRQLNTKIEQLEKQVSTVSQTFKKQQETATAKEVEAFAAEHTRFDELSADIEFFLKTRTNDLSEAYTLAERLNPAPAKPLTTEASTAPVIDLKAQTEKGQKSINGAPSHGSSPSAKPPSTSIKESLKRAMAQAG